MDFFINEKSENMKITNPYNTTIRTNHDQQPIEPKKVNSVEATENNTSGKSLESEMIQNTEKQSKTGHVVTKEVQTIIIALKDKLPLNSEVVHQLTEFVKKSEGTLEQKLESLKFLLNKNLELTQSHLKAIHQALHGKLYMQEVNGEQHLPRNKVQEKITSLEENIFNQKPVKEVINQVEKVSSQGISLDNSQSLEEIPTENKELLKKVKAILSETHQINFENQEFQVDSNRHEKENINPNNNKNLIIENEYQQSLTSLNLQSKDIVVNTITKRLAEATIQFRDLKSEIIRNIDQITTTHNINKNSYQNKKQL